MYHVLLHGVSMEDCVEPTDVRNLFVAPASLDLAGAEIELVSTFNRELQLRNAIHSVIDDYDYVLIDCPPSLGLLSVNGLAAADEVMLPIQCEYFALEGVGQLITNVGRIRTSGLNPGLEISTIACVMYDSRTKLSEEVVTDIREHFGDKVLRTVVPPQRPPVGGSPPRPTDHALRPVVPRRHRLPGHRTGGTRCHEAVSPLAA